MKLSEVLKDGIYVLREKNISDYNLKASFSFRKIKGIFNYK